MAEEQRCQEGHRLCANNCGFFGSPATLHLCSKCYRDFRLKEDHASSAKIAVEKSLQSAVAAASSSPASLSSSSSVEVTETSYDVRASPAADVGKAAAPAAAAVQTAANRCAACRKKVRLTGFKCRCGSTYCGAHRYAEQHACGFDFKAAGREAIARANPVIKADKLEKI